MKQHHHTATVFFVLKGLRNVEHGSVLADGWYCERVGEKEPDGPFLSADQAHESAERSETIVILGRCFVAMSESDRECYQGAEPGTLISSDADVTLLWDPDTKTLSEMYGEHGESQRDWSFVQISGGDK